MFAGDEVASPVLEIERLRHSRPTSGRPGEGCGKKHPDIGNGAIALQSFRLRIGVPAVVQLLAILHILVSRGLYFDCSAGLGNEIER